MLRRLRRRVRETGDAFGELRARPFLLTLVIGIVLGILGCIQALLGKNPVEGSGLAL